MSVVVLFVIVHLLFLSYVCYNDWKALRFLLFNSFKICHSFAKYVCCNQMITRFT